MFGEKSAKLAVHDSLYNGGYVRFSSLWVVITVIYVGLGELSCLELHVQVMESANGQYSGRERPFWFDIINAILPLSRLGLAITLSSVRNACLREKRVYISGCNHHRLQVSVGPQVVGADWINTAKRSLRMSSDMTYTYMENTGNSA